MRRDDIDPDDEAFDGQVVPGTFAQDRSDRRAADCKPAQDSSEGETTGEEDDDWDDQWPAGWWRTPGDDKGGGSTKQTVLKSQLQRLEARVNFDPLPLRQKMSHGVRNEIIAGDKKASASRNLGLTRDTRATVEQVLDPRTMLVLSKFLKRGVLNEIHGCVSTGKEANVYYATRPGTELAVKVYKTSILVFKDRARYVEGEYRFRNGCSKGNPRKMVAQWAEKELRNLRRLHAAGLRCPEAFEVRQNVLVMQFLGEDGSAAPRLKDAEGLGPEDWDDLYAQCLLLMRQMMQSCKLVHGDLSEYNMLYHEGKVYLIDVSQSVESGHPQALDFLKRDCVNINRFFEKVISRPTVPVQRLFFFITSKLEGESDEQALDALLEDMGGDDVELREQEKVFINTWIPSNLTDISDRAFLEREMEKRARGEKAVCDRLLAESPAKARARDSDRLEEEDDSESDAESEEPGSGDDDGELDDAKAEKAGDGPVKDGHKPEGLSKAEWKAMVKQERREKLKEKIPKHTKKKYRKAAANRK